MKENIEKTKRDILAIIRHTDSAEDKLEQLNELIASFNPLENSAELFLVCDAAILLARRIEKTEMVAQLYFIKAKAEISKETFLIHEMKNLTLGLGWFGFALKSEKDHYNEVERRVNETWTQTQRYLDLGFNYLKIRPYVGVAGYCYKMVGEIYGSFYLQQKLYLMKSNNQPLRARISNYKISRFLGLDDLLLVDMQSRQRLSTIKADSLRNFKESIKCYKKEGAWRFLSDCYISLGLEHHSFNNPVRGKIALYKAKRLIKKYKILTLEERLESVQKLPLIGSDRV